MFKLLAVLFSWMLILSACATKIGPAEAYRGETPQQIFAAGEANAKKGDFNEAIKRFEALEVQYPLEKEAELAAVHLIYAYYRKEEYAQAEAAAARFIREHPISAYTDYAYFMQGLADYYQHQGILDRIFGVDLAKRDVTPLKKAYAEFAAIVEQFPQSRYAPAAYQYMIYLRNILARHQLQVAEFYFKRKAYVAAIDRATGVIKNYQGAPSIPAALVVIAQAYQKLGLTQQYQAVVHLLNYNYPHSSYSQEVGD